VAPYTHEVYLKYRAKNSFGGYIITEYVFYFGDDGRVAGAKKIS
jgi:hypothetical protein